MGMGKKSRGHHSPVKVHWEARDGFAAALVDGDVDVEDSDDNIDGHDAHPPGWEAAGVCTSGLEDGPGQATLTLGVMGGQLVVHPQPCYLGNGDCDTSDPENRGPLIPMMHASTTFRSSSSGATWMPKTIMARES